MDIDTTGNMRKQPNWIKETDHIVSMFKARLEPLWYTYPAINAKCHRCGEAIEDGKEVIHIMDSTGYTVVYCSDDHFYWR